MNISKKHCALLLPLLLWTATCFGADPIRWDYVSSETSFEGKWETVKGEADVKIDGQKLSVSIYTPLNIPGAGTRNQPIGIRASNTLDGTISEDGRIIAVEHSVDSEPNDVKVGGYLYRRVDHEKWGNKDVKVVYETIILAGTYLFIGLTHRYIEK